jgi:hypothetical protein
MRRVLGGDAAPTYQVPLQPRAWGWHVLDAGLPRRSRSNCKRVPLSPCAPRRACIAELPALLLSPPLPLRGGRRGRDAGRAATSRGELPRPRPLLCVEQRSRLLHAPIYGASLAVSSAAPIAAVTIILRRRVAV